MPELPSDIARSREFEMKTYVNSMHAIYENAVLQNGEVFDLALTETRSFTEITPAAIIADSRIIPSRVLRRRKCAAEPVKKLMSSCDESEMGNSFSLRPKPSGSIG